VIGVSVTFQYDEDFDRARVISIAENERKTFEGMPGLRWKVFTVDDTGRRAMNFYVWESADAAKSFFSEEVREMVTGLYGVEPTIDFVEIAQTVDNSGTSQRKGPKRRRDTRSVPAPGDHADVQLPRDRFGH
jgi:heme-degrading monooxygenase HmoA